MTRGQLLSSMTEDEFDDWIDFYNSEPFGPIRDNMHSAQIAVLLKNRWREEGAPPATMRDYLFLPEDADPEHAEQGGRQRVAGFFDLMSGPKPENGDG